MFFYFLGELGDYDPMTCRMGYLSEYQFFPGQVCMIIENQVCCRNLLINPISDDITVPFCN